MEFCLDEQNVLRHNQDVLRERRGSTRLGLYRYSATVHARAFLDWKPPVSIGLLGHRELVPFIMNDYTPLRYAHRYTRPNLDDAPALCPRTSAAPLPTPRCSNRFAWICVPLAMKPVPLRCSAITSFLRMLFPL